MFAAGAAGQLHQLGHRAQLGRVRPFDVDRLQVQRVQLPTQLTRLVQTAHRPESLVVRSLESTVIFVCVPNWSEDLLWVYATHGLRR